MPAAAATRRPAADPEPGTLARPGAVHVCKLAIPGRAEHVQHARQFTDLVLTAHSRDDEGTCGLLVSELVTNSLLHSDSGVDGGIVTITITLSPGEILVAVTDDGGAGEPALSPDAGGDDDAEHGRGLFLVQQLSGEWGHDRQGRQLTTWFTTRRTASPHD